MTRAECLAHNIARLRYTGRDPEARRRLRSIQEFVAQRGENLFASEMTKYEALVHLATPGRLSDKTARLFAEKLSGQPELIVAALRGRLSLARRPSQ